MLDMATPPPFPFRKREQNNDFNKVTLEWIRQYQDSTDNFDIERVKIKQLYLRNRNSLLEQYYGKYVFVTTEKIVPTDFTELDRKEKNPVKDTWGIWFKVGEEVDLITNAFYSGSLSSIKNCAYLPLDFGKRDDNKLWFREKNIIVDTGCNITTFDTSVLYKIKNLYPNFHTTSTLINVIGGSLNTENGFIDIDFCGKQFTINVNFARLPCVALIGMDLIKDGNLFYDPDKWISFVGN